jgi:P-type Mg2+ transporter
VIILLAAAVISALTGDLTSFIIISTIVLMSAVLDTVQEFRAEEAAEHLKVSVALKEQVLRDGQEVTVRWRLPGCRRLHRARVSPPGTIHPSAMPR